MSDGIERTLARLAEPEPPASLAPATMAAIARHVASEARPLDAPEPSRVWWLCATIGTVLVAGVFAIRWWSGGGAPGLFASRVGLGRILWLPGAGPGAIVIAVALLLFLYGAFAPLRRARTIERRA